MAKRFAIILGICLAIGAGLYVAAQNIHPATSRSVLAEKKLPAVSAQYYNQATWEMAHRRTTELTIPLPSNKIRAAIIPHDLLHAEYVVHLFSQLQDQAPSTVVVIGPDHAERGSGDVTTAAVRWSTPYGIVEPNSAIITTLMKAGIPNDPTTVQSDHAVTGLLPYLRYHLQNTTYVPIMLKSSVTLQAVNSLIAIIDEQLPSDALIIAAVDFSHYLVSEQAQANDLKTADLLASFDYQAILSFGPQFNDFVDSPPSIALLLRWLTIHGIKHSQIIYNTNSGLLAGISDKPVTSYFEVVYY